jgi:outer membrane lipoprotein-sorting protein
MTYRPLRNARPPFASGGVLASLAIGLLSALAWLMALATPADLRAADAADAGADAKPAKQGPSLLEKLRSSLSVPAKPKSTAEDQPAAHALYDQMVAAMRKAKSLSYVSDYKFEGNNFALRCRYRAWLKKPNYFRVEGEPLANDWLARFWPPEPSSFDWVPLPTISGIPLLLPVLTQPRTAPLAAGILIGDGKNLWIYWPQGRPRWYSAGGPKESDAVYAKTRFTSYMKKRAPLHGHSIGHEVCYLGGMSMPIIDPSTFHGYTDSLQEYIDGVKSLGTEKIGDEEFDKIEISIMQHQRSWFLWLSKSDHLPRKLKQIVRVHYDLVISEEWSSVTVNGDMPDTLFAWKPPEGWTRWEMPESEENLLKPGAQAPAFKLASADGTSIQLGDYRGQVVWLYLWRAG